MEECNVCPKVPSVRLLGQVIDVVCEFYLLAWNAGEDQVCEFIVTEGHKLWPFDNRLLMAIEEVRDIVEGPGDVMVTTKQELLVRIQPPEAEEVPVHSE